MKAVPSHDWSSPALMVNGAELRRKISAISIEKLCHGALLVSHEAELRPKLMDVTREIEATWALIVFKICYQFQNYMSSKTSSLLN